MILAHALHQPVGFNRRDFTPDLTSRYEVLRRVKGGDDITAATVSPGTTQAVLAGANESDASYYVRVLNRCNLPDRDPIRIDLKRVAFDGLGVLILPAPLAPRGLSLTVKAGGEIQARWVQPRRRNFPAAASFNLYVATGAAAIDYTTPTVSFTAAGQPITRSVGSFAHGTAVKVSVRAVSAQGVEEPNQVVATATADAQAPPAVAGLSLEVTPG